MSTSTTTLISAAQPVAIDEHEALYRDMFHASAVSTWHLDTSRAMTIYRQLYADGVSDILAYAQANPAFVHQALDATRVIDVNDETLRLFGIGHRSEIIGKSVAPFWIDGCYDTFLGCVQCSFSGLLTFRSETRLRALDGRELHVLFTKSESVRLLEREEALLSIADMTERVEAQRGLALAQAKLAHSERIALLGELTASIAQEVNQPIDSVLSYIEVAQRLLEGAELDLAQVKGVMTKMIEGAKCASLVVDRIRAMVTPAASDPRPVGLNDVVRMALRFVDLEVSRLDVEVSLELDDKLPEVFGHPVQLQQVIINVALNALQAMEASVVRRLVIRTSRCASDRLRLAVQDSGRGLTPDHLERLFTSFFTTRAAGIGMGLGISRTIVEAHNGTIQVSNCSGGGALVTIFLPIYQSGY